MSSVMELKGLRKRYEEKGDWILKGIDLRIEKQDFIAIMGRSGCGKAMRFPDCGEARLRIFAGGIWDLFFKTTT